jgi:valyl-tRNA synthetase
MRYYNAKEVEEKIKKFWEKEEIYKFDSKKKGKIYSIDTPPPTVSGDMHIGHAFSYSQQDFIVRFRRMFEDNIFYPFGTDDNGLPTERLVERINKVKSKEMSRSTFIKLCLKTLKDITPDFVQQWKDLGISADYDIYYSTIDKNSQKISQKSFIDLFKAGRIYKKNFPTIWCPECQTAIAQAELEDKEFPSSFSIIKFKAGGKTLPIATTRPELIPACVAIFVNPEDKRYKNLVGKKAKVPLFNYEVPIFEDKSADIEKGTGVMMVCSYGDKFDVDAINRYKLKPRIIFNYDGTLNFREYKGMKIREARKKILKEFKDKGLIINQKQISHIINVHDKCGTGIEFLPTEQWFIKVLDKKKKLIEQGKKIKWYPKFMYKRFENWINGLEWDWNISRDRHFGVSIPAWYCRKCDEIIIADEKELPLNPSEIEKKCSKCKGRAEPEIKVLDTWATSSLTPQIASSLVGNKIKLPYSLRPQAHDIIRTWAFYTIVKAYLHENKIPWKNIVVSGFVRLEGEKMSKSKGNIIEPGDVIQKYGSDSLRFWAAGSKLGEDLNYQEKDLVAGKRFVTKLFNASKFVFMGVGKSKPKKPKKLQRIDERFLIELNRVLFITTHYFKEYNYSRAKFNIEEFFWKFFCDYYLEIVKRRIYNEKGDKKKSAQYVLYQSFLAILKMIAPIMPFITEEIYQTYYKKHEKGESIHLSKWPKFDKKLEGWDDKNIKSHANELTLFVNLLTKIRAEKTKAKKSMNTECILTINKINYEDLKELLEDLKNVTNAKKIKTGKFKVEFK